MALEKEQQRASNLFKEIEELNNLRRSLYWEEATRLHKLKKDNLFRKVHGSEGQSWASFCSENHLVKSSSDQKVKVYELFVKTLGFTQEELYGLDTTGLYYIALYKPNLSKKEASEWLGSLKVMGRGDFYQEISGKGECSHEHTEESVAYVCQNCHRKVGSKHESKKGN